MKPRLIVEQKITALVNKYSIYTANEDGSRGELMALAQQKRLAFKEKVSFYADNSKSELAFTFRAEKAMDIHGKFFVEDAVGTQIGMFKKDFKKSLVNSTWHILNPDDSITLSISETNQTLATLRRYASFIPIVGDIADIVLAFFLYHFTFKNEAGETVGQYQKTTRFRDHYILSMDESTYNTQDWRTLAAMAVALDALQGR
jgi:uncharacterized protein YxjI